MKRLKQLLSFFLLIAIIIGCTQDDDNTDFVNAAAAPSNISALVTITQDNTGLVTIAPLGEGVASFKVDYGDSSDPSEDILPGENIEHIYEEGTYNAIITARGLNGKTTSITQSIMVSFQAPENLVVLLENDLAVSKQVNVTVTADYALSYEVSFGDPASTVIMSNIDDVTSFIYDDAGTYTITVTAMSAAIETTSYTEVDFEVTEILAPLDAAPTPPSRDAEDVVSIFSDAYTDVTLNELPTTWSATAFAATTVDSDNVWQLTNLDFLGIVTNYDNGIDLSAMEKMHIDYWVPSGTTNELLVKIVNTVDGGEDVESLGTTVSGSWQSIDLDMTGFDGGDLANKNKITQLLIDSDGVSGVVYIDNFYFWKAGSTSSFDDGLLTNGDFENGSDSWLVGVDDNAPAPVVTNAGNTYYSVDVATAGDAFAVNVSQKVEIIQGNTYTLTFDAWSDVNRPILAGIGLSGPPWSNTAESVDITTTRTTYTLTHIATDFGAIDARVLFDLGAATGMVNIDNVSLIIGTGNSLINGDFENGSDPWIVGVDDNAPAPVVTNAGNTYYSVDVVTAGDAFAVNVSQKVEIIQGNTYTLTFDAWSDVNRPILAGIGLSGPPWSNTAESVDITTTRTTYTLTHIATDFGAIDARVLFDLGAATGMVNIDDVSLSSN